MKLEFNKKLFFILLVFFIVIDIISTCLLFSITQIIHGDLYNFGLKFSTIWANNYWINMDATQTTVWASMILSGFLIGLLCLKNFKDNKKILTISFIIFLSVTFTAVLGIFLMTALDKIVLIDLGLYGVAYDFQWTHEYYLFTRFFLGLKIAIVVATTLLSSWTGLLLLKPKQIISKLASIVLMITGGFTLLLSTLSGISDGVIVGFGLIITGIIIGYITSQEFIKKDLLISQLTSTYDYIEENIKKFGKFDKAVYIPSYLTKDNENTILLLKNINEANPKTKNINSTKIVTKAYTLTPPGNELVQLFEKKLNTNFAKIDLSFLQKNLPQLITEDLEIATNLLIQREEETVKVEFDNSVFNDKSFDQKFSGILKTFGCPLSSAIGCAIAKATGKLTAIKEYSINYQRKNVSVKYELMPETVKLTFDNLN